MGHRHELAVRLNSGVCMGALTTHEPEDVSGKSNPRRSVVAGSAVLWDINFKSAVAQAELEDRERPGVYYRITSRKHDQSTLSIETTKPESHLGIALVWRSQLA